MRVGLCQIVSGVEPEANLELVADGIRRAAAEGADIAVFPEATMACFGVKLSPLAEPLDGPWATEVRRLADDQIENHGGRDNRDARSGRALPEYGEAPAAQFQLGHGTVGRGEPERGAAAQHDGVDALDGVVWL